MATKRQHFSSQFKHKVALEALKETKTLTELSSEFEVHSTQISRWKKMLIEESCDIFKHGNSNGSKTRKGDKKEAEMLQKIGQQAMEINWLKKKLSR